jgi:RND family efflux transporter MFP subunit
MDLRRHLAALAAASVAAAAPVRAQESDFDCLIEPQAVTEVATRELGVLEEILVDRGDFVEMGQVVARLESGAEKVAVELMRARADMDAQLEEARVRADFAKRHLERTSELYRQKTISDFENDEATTEAAEAELQLRQVQQRHEAARLELRQAEKQLARRTIRSPISGVVVRRLLEVGESVEDRPMLEIAQIDPLNVELIVPVAHYGSIEIGALAEVLPHFPGAELRTATVTIVDRVVDAASGTFGVRLELPNPDHRIPGGVRCEVRFLP